LCKSTSHCPESENGLFWDSAYDWWGFKNQSAGCFFFFIII